MNTLIEKLSNTAKKSVPHGLTPDKWIEVYNEKFAELIVKEMLQTCEDHPAWTGRMISEQIKQHFGVTE